MLAMPQDRRCEVIAPRTLLDLHSTNELEGPDMSTTFEIDYIWIIDELSAAGYCPADDFDEVGDTYTTSPTVAHFADRGWGAVRVLSDYIQFARFDDEGFALMMTNHNGCISSESKFSTDRHGMRMFTVAAELRP